MPREKALELGGARVAIDTPTVDGSFLLTGARFDDLHLKNYHETVGSKEPRDRSPGADGHRLSLFRRVRLDDAEGRHRPPCPTTNTVWQLVNGDKLASGQARDAQLGQWTGSHLHARDFGRRQVHVHRHRQRARTSRGVTTMLYPYALVVRDGVPASIRHLLGAA